MNPNLASQSAPEDAVIKLKCPQCSGGLNLRRKHMGILGKCVHCKTPIMAVEEGGKVFLKHMGEKEASQPESPKQVEEKPTEVTAPESSAPSAPPETPAQFAAPGPAPQETASSAPESLLNQEDDSSRFVPPPMPEGSALETPVEKETENSDSAWGFPKRGEDSIAPISPLPKMKEETTPPAPAMEENKGSSDSDEGSGLPPEFGFSEAPSFNLGNASPAAEEAQEDPSNLPASNPSDLFESNGNAAEAPGFSHEEESAEVNSGWGAKVPNQNHASISPFSTGSAEPDPGFAETLFREKAEEETGKIQPKSPFGELGATDEAPKASGALFSNTVTQRVTKPEPTVSKPDQKQEVVLDGDGRPLREMTPEEKEQFAKDIMTFSEDRRKRSPWLRRIRRFFMTVLVLGGLGYGAYVFMPEEQFETAKAKVFDWLEPGSVLLDYLPFDVTETEDGEKEVKIKALEGLDNLSNQMDAYLSTAEDQLNETLPEGAKGYEREDPIDMPEMPKMPNIPGLKMPSMPGSAPAEKSGE
ncbi:MAG: hypothetical protein AAF733_00040 [Verrucomicrobiota bacterium]